MTTPPAPIHLADTLASAWAKVRRANQHLRSLDKSIKRYGNGDKHAFEPEVNLDAPEEQYMQVREAAARGLVPPDTGVRLGPLYIKVAMRRHLDFRAFLTPTKAPPSTFWSLLIGETVAHLGSALDYLVKRLGDANPNRPTMPAGANATVRREWRGKELNAGFPAAASRQDWNSAPGKRLFFVDGASRDVIERAQPFYAAETRGENPHVHPLYIVTKLWNRDKHEDITVTTAVGRLTGAGAHLVTPPLDDVHCIPHTVALHARELNGRTEVGRLRVEFSRPLGTWHGIGVHMRCDFSLNVLFAQGTPGEGENALQKLTEASSLTADLLRQFK